MSTCSLGSGNLAPELDLLNDVTDKVGQRTAEPLIASYVKTGMLVLNEYFSHENCDDSNYVILTKHQ